MRDAAWAQARRLRIPLTGPQLLAVRMLVDEWRASNSGLSVSELSRRMGLAHSTVSGIVDRLEQRAFVQRVPRPDDRRFVSVELTVPVREWVRDELPSARADPVAAAMRKATGAQRELIVTGLEILHQLLDRTAAGPEA